MLARSLLTATLASMALTTTAAAQNPTQIEAVRKGAMACVACNLFQADFAYLDLTGRNLSRARLRQADLTVAIMDSARLARADLSIVNAFGARFTGADLTGADLTDASLVGAHFERAILSGANLARANLSGADLSGARGLTQAQAGLACGDAETRLPLGISIPRC